MNRIMFIRQNSIDCKNLVRIIESNKKPIEFAIEEILLQRVLIEYDSGLPIHPSR